MSDAVTDDTSKTNSDLIGTRVFWWSKPSRLNGTNKWCRWYGSVIASFPTDRRFVRVSPDAMGQNKFWARLITIQEREKHESLFSRNDSEARGYVFELSSRERRSRHDHAFMTQWEVRAHIREVLNDQKMCYRVKMSCSCIMLRDISVNAHAYTFEFSFAGIAFKRSIPRIEDETEQKAKVAQIVEEIAGKIKRLHDRRVRLKKSGKRASDFVGKETIKTVCTRVRTRGKKGKRNFDSI